MVSLFAFTNDCERSEPSEVTSFYGGITIRVRSMVHDCERSELTSFYGGITIRVNMTANEVNLFVLW